MRTRMCHKIRKATGLLAGLALLAATAVRAEDASEESGEDAPQQNTVETIYLKNNAVVVAHLGDRTGIRVPPQPVNGTRKGKSWYKINYRLLSNTGWTRTVYTGYVHKSHLVSRKVYAQQQRQKRAEERRKRAEERRKRAEALRCKRCNGSGTLYTIYVDGIEIPVDGKPYRQNYGVRECPECKGRGTR